MASWNDFKPTSKAFDGNERVTLPSSFDATTGKPSINQSTFKVTTGRCTDHHPPLPLPNSSRVIYGGACDHPVQKDCDVYVGLTGFYDHSQPWDRNGPLRISYPITDMAAPRDAKSFKAMIAWLKEALDKGMKVHVGCLGGHGRTGTVLAALVAAYGEKDAITYVRQHYCQKAVESHEQVVFLAKHFDVKIVGGAKERAVRSSRYDLDFDFHNIAGKRSTGILEGSTAPKLRTAKKDKVEPLKDGGSIFGERLIR